MKTLICLILFCTITSQILASRFFRSGPYTDSPNPVNPNFHYPEFHLVQTASGNIPYPGQMYTGYITVNQTSQSKIFYTLFAAGGNTNAKATVNDSAPLILWLQGGPGCADEGQYTEMGPYNVISGPNGSIPVTNGITWNSNYHMLFVDAPVGVGYSVVGGDLPVTAMEYAAHMQDFLMRFFEIYTSQKGKEFYIFGESYAGHYIPAVTSYLIQHYETNKIKVSGIGIGNGWTDPVNHMKGYSDFAYSAGLVDTNGRDTLSNLENQFVSLVQAGNFSGASAIFDQVDDLISNLFTNTSWLNIYNYRNNSGTPSDIWGWLNINSTKTLLGADLMVHWGGCVDAVYEAFYPDISQSYASNTTYILSQKVYDIKVLIYNGQDDVIVNTAGVQRYITNLKWVDLPHFLSSTKHTWKDKNGYVLGNYQRYGRLNYMNVNKAGHMVPGDQPWSAYDMVQRFIKNDWALNEEPILEEL